MIIATAIVYQQFDYLTSKDLGYEPDNVVKVVKRNLSHREAKIFEEELIGNPNILSVSPHRHGMMNGKINGDVIMNFTYEAVDENFIDLLKIHVVQGRNFSSLYPSDSANAVVINEVFVKAAGWTDAIGQEVKMMDGTSSSVVGIVKNYNYESLKKTIEPQLFSLAFDAEHPSYQQVLIRIQTGTEASSISYIEKTFKKLFPMQPYQYQFYDDLNFSNYESEFKWKQVILLSALLTILIAGIGLFGLSILTSESKFKEIGIRKVLGASLKTIVFELYKKHLSLILIALLLAIPIGYYVTDVWLDNYPYRIEVGAGTFIGTGLIVLLIGGITISYQTIKTGLLNPVDSLRTE